MEDGEEGRAPEVCVPAPEESVWGRITNEEEGSAREARVPVPEESVWGRIVQNFSLF